MKLSVFTVSTPELGPEELAAAAKEAGLHGIEWRYAEVPPEKANEPPSFWGNNRCTISPSGGTEELERFKRAAERHGLTTLSVTPYLRAGDLEATERALQAARQLGASFIRLGVPAYDGSKSFDELFGTGRAYFAEAEKLCARYGVRGLAEIHHGTIAASASGARRLVDGFDPESIGVLFDPGNMIHEGVENYRMALQILGPYLAHVHVKNAAWAASGPAEDGSATWNCAWVGLKDGAVPWRRVVGELKAIGYEGYLGVEDFSMQFSESADMLRHFAEYVGGLVRETDAHA
ncbi:sugar phosphate isomerase/epimerase family protein [Paenibacillaceae bacterium WGS1546]|uniref:sugar phosphate isomerase/epimerase family protein n=1 Tax=Cohnella sp. WGS1546 TaxID=3366810 RepID=UPI00372D6205